MLEKLMSLKENNKLLYYILFPLILLGIILKILSDNNLIGATKDLRNTEKETSDLQNEINDLNDQADALVDEAKDILDSDTDIGEWHNE